MKLVASLFFLLLSSYTSIAQISSVYGIAAKEFSKEIALYRAKQFVMTEVLGESQHIVQFQIDPLAASGSGELTSLVYKCQAKNKEGLVLGFFGDYWNSAGVSHKVYSFLDLPREEALVVLSKIEEAVDDNSKFLNKDVDNNNIYYLHRNVTFLIYASGSSKKIRVFWKEFDSEWDMTAFRRTKRRLLHKLD